MSNHNCVEEQFDNIHPDNDSRSYRGLVLTNKMRIFLISDPSTDISFASMDVNAGDNCNPDDLPGLAHLCEHMLLLGTEKYRKQDDYHMYVTQSNGQQNATTSLSSTNYWFTASPEKFKEVLDRFAQFFIAPLFRESLIEKEINGSIDAEYKEYLTLHGRRYIQLEKLCIKPDQPYSKFGTGNGESLSKIPKEKNINVRNRLLEFYNTYYSANVMSLCIHGKESLDDLTNMVIERFCNVENKEVELPMYSEYPFKDEDFNTIWYYVPIHDTITQLVISFALPEMQREYRMPLDYIAHLFKHKSEGLLVSALKARGWCNTIIAGKDSADTSIHYFKVIFELTEKGIKHVEDIILIMFQYINMLKKNGPMKWIYDEHLHIWNMCNRYRSAKIHSWNPNNIATIAYLLHIYPMENIISLLRDFPKWRPDLINELMEYFTPQNIRIYVAAKAYESIANKTEKWFGTKYMKEKISEKTMKMWNHAGYKLPDLKLPSKNEFIATKFDIKTEINDQEFPLRIVKDTSFVKVWYKEDNVFRLPHATMIFHFVSPFAYMDPLSSNLTNMFVNLLRDFLDEYACIVNIHKHEFMHTVDITSLEWKITTTKYGITLKIDGFDDKQRVLLEKIMDQMTNFKLNPKRFEVLKEKHIKYLKNFATILQTPKHAKEYLHILLSERHWSSDELLASTARCHILYEEENKVHENSCTIVNYATGLRSTESNMLLSLLAQIISGPCYDVLRTTEQLGYIILSDVCTINETQYLTVVVQGERNPQNVEERIDSFMENMFEHITNMPEEQFNNYKEGLVVRLINTGNTITSQCSLYWKEIESKEYNFDRVNIEVPYLRTITQQRLLQFFEENIRSKLTRRKLSVHVMPTAMAMEKNLPDTSRRITVTSSDNKIKKFDNLMSFKLSQSLYI
ncbi:insulin-degrading enzyme-like isoform X2 [Temnothorax curvispinosus]|uniref:Insulin-degrading enzyme-like isoform X2 n=1 Tax=Temnothorax curvispinosus TaxID=300111 RepID=A0A6J1R1J2_9HYME|nr:insulin-degrading enzyme-like isoform X2 [Temnothorax curvispinosus]